MWDRPRVGTTVEELCAGWLRDMAPFGQGNREHEPPTCTTGDGLTVQGVLPEGQSVAGGVVLRYRIGAIACTDHALVFRASGGRFLGGPVYRSDDAAGDGGEFLAARASVVRTANGPALVVATVSSFGIVDGAATTPEGPQVFHHAARSCLCTARGYACDVLDVFDRTRMDPESSRVFLRAPIPKAPALDPQGHVRAAPHAP